MKNSSVFLQTCSNFFALLTAGDEASVLALGSITGSTIQGEQEVFLWSYSSLGSLDVQSAGGGATLLTNGSASLLEVAAAGDALLAALGGTLSADVEAGGAVDLFGLGITGEVTAGGRLRASSFGSLNLPSFEAGGDVALMATAALSAAGTAGSDMQLVSYGPAKK